MTKAPPDPPLLLPSSVNPTQFNPSPNIYYSTSKIVVMISATSAVWLPDSPSYLFLNLFNLLGKQREAEMPQTDTIGHSENAAVQTGHFSPLFTP